MLTTLVYGSAARKKMSGEELADILRVSRKNNKAKDITGILLYKNGYFLQVLEGDEKAVESLYNHISEDPRHMEPLVYFKRRIEERMFDEWSMGFTNLDEVNPSTLPGYSDYLNEPLNSKRFTQNPSMVQTFLNVFKKRHS